MLALESVDIEVSAGEVLAILGDNGAGKSTLIKCISGVYRLDAGTIEVGGKAVAITSPAAARSYGIETVYQDLALFDNLDPAANFYAGREDAGPSWVPAPLRILRRRSMASATTAVLDRLQVTLPDATANVGLMSGGQRQVIAVARELPRSRPRSSSSMSPQRRSACVSRATSSTSFAVSVTTAMQ